MNLTDRTGQVWIDRSLHDDGEIVLVLGPPSHDAHYDAKHPVIVLYSQSRELASRNTWFESVETGEWEFYHLIERLA